MINVFIDEFTPCLKDGKTGELVQTEVLRVGRKSFLKKYNEKNGWYVTWMCASPENNHQINQEVKYKGVGGHLFAIAAKKSIEWGYGGMMYGFAADKTLLEHYMSVFNAEFIGIQHPFHFLIDEENAKKITEVYTYEWTDDEI